MVEEVLSLADVAADLEVTDGPVVGVEGLEVAGQSGSVVEHAPRVGDCVDVLDGETVGVVLLLHLRLGAEHLLQELQRGANHSN